VTGQKTKIVIAVVLAISSAFLLLSVSYIFFPDETLQQPPAPLPASKPSLMIDQILWAVQWIAIAAVIAAVFVGAILLFSRVINKKTV
jgi:hypothetical protein